MKILRLASFAALCSLALGARATLLDFEDLAGTGVDNGTITSHGPLIGTQGYSLFTTGDSNGVDYGLDSEDPSSLAVGRNYTGSLALYDGTTGSTTIIQKLDGKAFDVTSIDLGNLYVQDTRVGGATVGLVGVRTDGSTVERLISLQPSDGLQPQLLSGFKNLSSFKIGKQGAPFFQFDNIAVQAVPEPASLAALGLGACGLLRRRKRD